MNHSVDKINSPNAQQCVAKNTKHFIPQPLPCSSNTEANIIKSEHHPSEQLKNVENVNASASDQEQNDLLCHYSSKKCFEPRTKKQMGGLHKLCEFHRRNANRNQRKSDKLRRNRIKYKAAINEIFDGLNKGFSNSPNSCKTSISSINHKSHNSSKPYSLQNTNQLVPKGVEQLVWGNLSMQCVNPMNNHQYSIEYKEEMEYEPFAEPTPLELGDAYTVVNLFGIELDSDI